MRTYMCIALLNALVVSFTMHMDAFFSARAPPSCMGTFPPAQARTALADTPATLFLNDCVNLVQVSMKTLIECGSFR